MSKPYENVEEIYKALVEGKKISCISDKIS